MRKISLLVPDLPNAEELRPYLERIDAARVYTNFGPLVLELEAKLKAHFRAAAALHLTTVANCTVGLELALWALLLRPRARVLIPAITFVATAAAVVRAGYEPVLSDVDERTWLLTPEIARRAIARIPVDAVMPVSTYGCPQDTGAWDDFSRATGVPVVIDAAGAFGNQQAGERSTLVFSLHATKVLSGAEGGFVVSADAALIARVRRMSNFGIEFSSGIVDVPGTNAKLSEYHAAIVLAMLERLQAHAGRRVELHRRYLQSLAAAGARVTLQQRPAEGMYSILPVLLPAAATAQAVAQALSRDGIETRRWYCPAIHHHPGFAGAAVAGALDIVNALSDRLLALPFHPLLLPEDIEFVCTRLNAALAGIESSHLKI